MEERFLVVEEGSYKYETENRNNPYGAYRLNSSETKRVYVTEEQSKFLPMEHDKKHELLTWAPVTIF